MYRLPIHCIMLQVCVMVGVIAALSAGEAATSVITVPSAQLAANTPNQTVTLTVSGGASVAGMNLVMMIGNGSVGPKVTNVNLRQGTIWGANAVATNSGSMPQLVSWNVVTESGAVEANGVLAILTIDTTNVPAGTYPVALTATVDGVTYNTELLDPNTASPIAVSLGSAQWTVAAASGAAGRMSGSGGVVFAPDERCGSGALLGALLIVSVLRLYCVWLRPAGRPNK